MLHFHLLQNLDSQKVGHQKCFQVFSTQQYSHHNHEFVYTYLEGLLQYHYHHHRVNVFHYW